MEVITQFGIEPKLLIAQMINFLLVLGLLYKFMYKPLVKMLEERKSRIAESMKQAQQIEDRLAKLEDEQAAILHKAQSEADRVLKEAQDSGKTIRDEAVVLAREQAEKIVARSQEQAKLEQEQMRTELKREIASLTVAVAEKVLQQTMTEQQKKELTQKAAKEALS